MKAKPEVFTSPHGYMIVSDAMIAIGNRAFGPKFTFSIPGAMQALMGPKAAQLDIPEEECRHMFTVAAVALHGMLQSGIINAFAGEALREIPANYWASDAGKRSINDGWIGNEPLFIERAAFETVLAASEFSRDAEGGAGRLKTGRKRTAAARIACENALKSLYPDQIPDVITKGIANSVTEKVRKTFPGPSPSKRTVERAAQVVRGDAARRATKEGK